MKNILYLIHRIPYPPNKGDKIRSYNILKYLSKENNVFLGTFIDNPDDSQYKKTVSDLCRESFFIETDRKKSILKSLSGFFKGTSLTVPYYKDIKMSEWVDNVLQKNKIDVVYIYSSSMAQYVYKNPLAEDIRKIIDFVDIDSDKWAQYAKSKSWPLGWVYNRESKKLQDFEKKIAKEFNASIFVSSTEAEAFKAIIPECSSRIHYINNGVDTDYFDPARDFDNPYNMEGKKIVFTGAMDYWANIDAVTWFANEIFPAIREYFKDALFYIVGSNPADTVKRLSSDSIVVTGSVYDIRPYIAHSDLVVVPMRIARGVQNKVLEGMAMGKTVVSTYSGYEGINAKIGEELFVENDSVHFSEKVIELLGNTSLKRVGVAARCFIEKSYRWESNLSRLEDLMEK